MRLLMKYILAVHLMVLALIILKIRKNDLLPYKFYLF